MTTYTLIYSKKARLSLMELAHLPIIGYLNRSVLATIRVRDRRCESRRPRVGSKITICCKLLTLPLDSELSLWLLYSNILQGSVTLIFVVVLGGPLPPWRREQEERSVYCALCSRSLVSFQSILVDPRFNFDFGIEDWHFLARAFPVRYCFSHRNQAGRKSANGDSQPADASL